MSVLSGKRILLGVTAGIAAYKIAPLTRLFVKAGAEVKIILTPKAAQFVTPLTLSTLSKNKVYTDFIAEDKNQLWNNHVELGLWADVMIIAPATASTISKMANGQCDNFLLATYLSARCPVYIAPAMDLDMYQHPTTQKNLAFLAEIENHIIPATSGELASGLVGQGRMAEPEAIFEQISNAFSLSKLPLKGKEVLITAGPTYEPIDPVRFIGNHSSGKMGYALAEVARNLGANVTLISGPSALAVPKGVKTIKVFTTAEMYSAVHQYYKNSHIVIAAAAVSDYKPVSVANQKIKKKENTLALQLEKTQDILLSLGENKTHQFLVGFALETENEVENAQKKLSKKNLDLIVLNSLNDKGAGFKTQTNKIKLISENSINAYDLKDKHLVAKDIFDAILEKL